MKKLSTTFQKLLSILFLLCSSFISIAQSKPISISIKGIEYDDPFFSLLKQTLQKNKNVTAFKTAFDEGTAKLNLNYPRNAQNLWDELPSATKQSFKISSIDDSRIVLESKGTAKETTNTNNTKTNSISSEKKDGCTTCYIDLCKYDGIKTFQGVAWYGINYDEGTYYYRCENGILFRKQIWVNGYGNTTNITTDTILYINKPVGYSWGWRKENSEDYDMDMRIIVAKGITVQIDGKTYEDVIVVNRKTAHSNNGMRINTVLEQMIAKESGTSINAYYVRGASIAKIQELALNTNPLEGVKKFASGDVINIIESTTKQTPLPMKGIIDPSIVGTWKYHDDAINSNNFYIFRADGTYDNWSDMITPKALPSNYNNFWRIDGEVLEFLPEGGKEVVHEKGLKRNDPQTNRPALVIEWSKGYYRNYFPIETKASWNIPTTTTNKSTENKTVSPVKLIEPPVKLNGVVDLSIVGLWKINFNNIDYYLDYKADGTYDTWSSTNSKKSKCYWRINNGFIETFCDGNKQVSRYAFKKNNDLKSGKPTISLDGSVYFSETDREMWK